MKGENFISNLLLKWFLNDNYSTIIYVFHEHILMSTRFKWYVVCSYVNYIEKSMSTLFEMVLNDIFVLLCGLCNCCLHEHTLLLKRFKLLNIVC